MATVLLTGANRGIGLELTKRFLEDGCLIHVCCRSPENARDLLKLAQQSEGLIQVHTLDVTNDAQREALKAQLGDQPIDLLLNNAGLSGDWSRQSFEDIDYDGFREVLEANTIAPMKMMQTFVENVAQSQRKIIANISTKMASLDDNASGGAYVYRSSKTALNMLSLSAARDLRCRGISVVMLHPGWVRTSMGGENGELSPEESSKLLFEHINKITPADNGRFIDIDGTTLPW